MKKIIITLTVLVSFIGNAQQTWDPYDEFMVRLGTLKDAKGFAEKYIDNLAKQKPEVPAKIWNSVKASINYTQFLKDSREVIKNNYTELEVNEIINYHKMVEKANTTGNLIYDPKPEVTEQMYNVGKDFGRQLNYQIKSRLVAAGH